ATACGLRPARLLQLHKARMGFDGRSQFVLIVRLRRPMHRDRAGQDFRPFKTAFTDEADMIRTVSCALGLVALALGGTLQAQQYDDVRSASYSDLSNLEARLANLDARATTVNNGGGSGGCCDGCCGHAGFITGGEIA